MKRKIILLLLPLLSNFVYSQKATTVRIGMGIVTKKNDTVKGPDMIWNINGFMTMEKFQIDTKEIKTTFFYNNTYNIQEVPEDPEKPDGKKESRPSIVPKLIYNDTAKVVVVITFYEDHSTTKMSGGAVSTLKTESVYRSYEEKPACYEFIKKQIISDLHNIGIKPILFLNQGAEGYYKAALPKIDKKISDSGANVVIAYNFYKSPRDKAVENNKVILEDFSSVSIATTAIVGKPEIYFTENVSYAGDWTKKRFGYRKLWSKFLIDFEKSKLLTK